MNESTLSLSVNETPKEEVWIELGPQSVERLQRIKQIILEEPRRFIMEVFFLTETDQARIARGELTLAPKWYTPPPCGTTACLCGWANILQLRDTGVEDKWEWSNNANMELSAMRWLDINNRNSIHDEESYRIAYSAKSNSDKLFYVTYWPKQYSSCYLEAATAQEAAQAAADYLDFVCQGPQRKEE